MRYGLTSTFTLLMIPPKLTASFSLILIGPSGCEGSREIDLIMSLLISGQCSKSRNYSFTSSVGAFLLYFLLAMA